MSLLRYGFTSAILVISLHGAWTKQPQSALAGLAAGWLAVCSFIFCCISFGVGSAMWVATIHI